MHVILAQAAKRPSWQRLPTSPGPRLAQIKDWLRCCEQNHSECIPTEHTQLPKRLVDLLPGNKHSDHGDHLALLVFSKDIAEEHPKYTALSYCWGDNRTFRTTCTTVGAFHQDIPDKGLPRSFAEAFQLTRQLGIRYIWIDALCIVQDDQLDWNTEVAKMHGVYAGSFLTIQASEASSSSEGCFVPINPQFAKTRQNERALFTTLDSSGGSSMSVHVIPHVSRTAAINKRGWTLQETVLSHRIIQLTNHELNWRCRAGLLLETGLLCTNVEQLYGNVLPLQKKHDQMWNRLWWSWIENYSSRRFSFSGDRLPGIAGLVELYQRETSDEPCLGLWRRSLHEDLAWMRADTLRKRSVDPPASQSLPSWSPFACRQTVEFGRWDMNGSKRTEIQHTIRVLDCTIEWYGTPFLSDLLSSNLVIRGPTRELHLSEATGIKDCNPPYFNFNDEIVDLKLPLPWRCTVQWDEEKYRGPGQWMCLMLQRHIPARETFLVLEAVEGRESEGLWRRIGLGSIRGSRNLAWTFDVDTCHTITLA
jgi:hypothetical protein